VVLEKLSARRVELMIKYQGLGMPPNMVESIVKAEINKMILDLGPADMAQYKHPQGVLVSLAEVPAAVLASYGETYAQADLEKGQFIRTEAGEYEFFLARETSRKQILKK
jgi:hypothetical protein